VESNLMKGVLTSNIRSN